MPLLELPFSLCLLCLQDPATDTAQEEAGSSGLDGLEGQLAEGYWRLGQALAAETGHPDQDYYTAAKVLLLCDLLQHCNIAQATSH